MLVSPSLLPVIVLGLVVCVVAQFIFLLGMNRRMARQSKMLRHFFSGPQGEDLEGLLARTIESARVASEQSQAAKFQINDLLSRFDGCVQHFALVRYDAFEEVTGQLSFSLAMLDGRDNGAIISTIYGRTNSRCYGKMITNGNPEQPLSGEEQRAFLQALESKVSRKSSGESFGGKMTVMLNESNHELVGAGRE